MLIERKRYHPPLRDVYVIFRFKMRMTGVCDLIDMGLSCSSAMAKLEEHSGPYQCPPTVLEDCTAEWATMAFAMLCAVIWGIAQCAGKMGRSPRNAAPGPVPRWRSRLPVKKRNGPPAGGPSGGDMA